jgi:hypothetical protein
MPMKRLLTSSISKLILFVFSFQNRCHFLEYAVQYPDSESGINMMSADCNSKLVLARVTSALPEELI